MQVTSIVACMLETGSDMIIEHLFGDCDLLGWLLNAPAQFEPERRAGDERYAHSIFALQWQLQSILPCSVSLQQRDAQQLFWLLQLRPRGVQMTACLTSLTHQAGAPRAAAQPYSPSKCWSAAIGNSSGQHRAAG